MEEKRTETERALLLLRENDYTCALCLGERVITSSRRGVAPLLELVRAGKDLAGFGAADKVVGKAAAFLYVLLGIEKLHALVLSIPAKEVLERYGIGVTYDVLVDRIRNRAGDGFCPMEQAVSTVEDPREALTQIEETLCRLQKHNK